ncbi:hypothetical protein A176_005904 [Myxococcus hansupus]|uniref:Uncharacterized protein n=1 Tax=Pseudomyxococcus hansupus TaxID=1297742 RepID=A0A0H4XL79_9BACT|nr:hypothetical protein A176_005904 [Myxococcus hansupus]
MTGGRLLAGADAARDVTESSPAWPQKRGRASDVGCRRDVVPRTGGVSGNRQPGGVGCFPGLGKFQIRHGAHLSP